MFSEQKWNQQYNLGLGYECKFLCNRIVCYRELTKALPSSLKQQCDEDQNKSGQQTYVLYPKQKLKNIIKYGILYTFLGCKRKIRIGRNHSPGSFPRFSKFVFSVIARCPNFLKLTSRFPPGARENDSRPLCYISYV